MGRRLYDNSRKSKDDETEDFVWKYVFAGQNNQLHLLATELGCGVYQYIQHMEIDFGYNTGNLEMEREGVERLREIVNTESNQDYMADYTRDHDKLFNGGGVAPEAFSEWMKKFAKEYNVDEERIFFMPMCVAIVEKAEKYYADPENTEPYVIYDEF